MKKIVRLTESDLVRLVKRVINEQSGPCATTIKKDCADMYWNGALIYEVAKDKTVEGKGLLKQLINSDGTLTKEGAYYLAPMPDTSTGIKNYKIKKHTEPYYDQGGIRKVDAIVNVFSGLGINDKVLMVDFKSRARPSTY